ncbi:hypothetical protein T484DRAFT_1744218 [Baffinella frigidus]|nr:hypothetical protein T484DRAFT_1744218 [Cryptophyta sp. CCMP2293]
MSSAPPPLPATSDAATDVARMQETYLEPPMPLTPEAPRLQAQQDNAGGSGVVDVVTPRRRLNEPKVALTRELLESHYHEPLDTVSERLGLSKTTIKAACRSLGLAKWPYQHTGARKRRMGVPKSEQDANSVLARTLTATFHELMGNNTPPSVENVSLKRQRVGGEQMAPTTTLGAPLSLLPATLPYLQPMHLQSHPALSAMGSESDQQLALSTPLTSPLPGASTLAGLQAMQRQSVLALSAMVTALSASDQQLALSTAVQGQAFAGQAPPPWTSVPSNP